MGVPCRIGTEARLFHPFGKIVEGVFEYPEKIVVGGDVAVPNWYADNNLCFRQ